MDISILLPDIEELIKAYEQNLIEERIKNSFDMEELDTNSSIMYFSPLVRLETGLEAKIGGTVSNQQMLSIVEQNVKETEEIKAGFGVLIDKISEEYKDVKDIFVEESYKECSITDSKGEKTNDFFAFENSSSWSTEPGEGDGYYYKNRLTNDINRKAGVNLTRAIDRVLGLGDGKINVGKSDKELNFGIEKCFNCMIKIDLEFAMPALEFVVDFTKFLNMTKKLLADLKKDLDPTKIYEMICKFSLGFGKNIICPSNLVGLNLTLPALFIKYSMDLASIRIDPMATIGKIISGAINGVVSLVENIPRLILPFLDCVKNATISVFSYLKTIVKSIEKIANDSLDLVNKTISAIHKTMLSLYDFLGGDLETFEEEKERKRKEIKEDLDKLSYEIRQRFIDVDNTKNQIRQNQQEQINNFYDYLLLQTYFVDYVFEKRTEIKIFSYQEFLDLFLEFVSENPLMGESIYKLAQVKDLMKELERLKIKEDQLSKKLNQDLENQIDAVKRAQQIEENKIESLENKMATQRMSAELVAERARYASQNEGFFPKINKGTGGKKPFTWEAISGKPIQRAGERDKFSLSSLMMFKYGIDIQSPYVEHEYEFIKNLRKTTNNTSKDLTDTFDSIQKMMVSKIDEARNFILKITRNIVLSFKNLDAFLGELVQGEFKILGEIKELIHLIRLFRVIYKLLSKGLTGCEDYKKEKDKLLEVIEEETPTAEGVVGEGVSLNKRDKDLIELKSKNGIYISSLNLNDCSDIISNINNNNNLDEIYEALEDGYFGI